MTVRLTLDLSENWQFQADPEGSGLEQQWFKDGLPNARSIKVPHTWNVEQGLEEYRGLAWYAYDLNISESWQGKLIRLQFDAVYRDAVVWLNGRQVGHHYHSGYTTFVLDITSYVHHGQSNRLVVSVNNENSEQALPIRNSFDWADDGGIIRGVSLLVTGGIAIDYAKIDAIPNFTEHSASAESGTIRGEIRLWQQAGLENKAITVRLSVSLKDKSMASDSYDLVVNEGKLLLNELTIAQPKLWHFDHPHLYNVHILLISEGKRPIS